MILEPSAVLDLVGFLFYDFAGTGVRDQRSCFNKRMGKKVMGDNITLHDDVTHPLQSGPPFDGEGMPRQKVLLVERGVPRNLVYARATAKKMKAKPTGHGLPLPNQDGEAPFNLVFGGGNTSVDDMVASTDRGILLTRLWYIREVDPYEKVLTGMTRDGSFLVENGAHRRRHPQFPLQPKHPRNALQRRATRPRRARRRRRILRDGRPRHEGPQLPLHRSNQVLAFTFSSPSHSFFTVVIPRSVATRNLSFCEASLRTKRSYHTHCHHETLRPMPDRLYYVYILASASRVLYTGVTNNLRRRVSQHKKPDPENPASTFTHKYQVTQLMHIEVFRDVRTAIAREKQIKAWTRAKRVALIDANNPRWKDLSEEWSQPSRPAKPAQPAQTKNMRDSSLRSE